MSGKVLLTGPTGLVGSDILRRLLEKQYEVIALSRRAPPTASARLTWIETDFAHTSEKTLAALPAVDYVIHAAAVRVGTGANELAPFRKVNMEFTEALFDWARARRVAAVVYLSGFNILRRPLAARIDEHHPLAPLTPYALTKYWGELALARHAEHSHFRGVILRLSSPIAFSFKLLHDTVLTKWIRQGERGQPLTIHGRGERTQDFVATEDIAAGVLQALQAPRARGIYHIASGTPLSMLDLATIVAGHWNVPITFEGEDVNEAERWNICLARACADLDYAPRYSSRTAVERLLATLLP